MSELRFHLDEDSESRALVRALRLRGVDLTTTAEAELTSFSDEAQLTWAAEKDESWYRRTPRTFVCSTESSLRLDGATQGSCYSNNNDGQSENGCAAYSGSPPRPALKGCATVWNF